MGEGYEGGALGEIEEKVISTVLPDDVHCLRLHEDGDKAGCLGAVVGDSPVAVYGCDGAQVGHVDATEEEGEFERVEVLRGAGGGIP